MSGKNWIMDFDDLFCVEKRERSFAERFRRRRGVLVNERPPSFHWPRVRRSLSNGSNSHVRHFEACSVWPISDVCRSAMLELGSLLTDSELTRYYARKPQRFSPRLGAQSALNVCSQFTVRHRFHSRCRAVRHHTAKPTHKL